MKSNYAPIKFIANTLVFLKDNHPLIIEGSHIHKVTIQVTFNNKDGGSIQCLLVNPHQRVISYRLTDFKLNVFHCKGYINA